MEADNLKENRQMELMLAPARERLKVFTPQELCEKGNLVYDESSRMFVLESMNQPIHISYPDFEMVEKLDMWDHLSLLQYMFTADGTPLTGEYIGLAEMRGGLSRGRSFDVEISRTFEKDFVDVTAEVFEQACISLGGEILNTKADASAVLHYAPMFPILVNYYEGDEEFAPSGKLLVDRHGEHYLEVEAAGSICGLVLGKIREQILKMQEQ